MEIKNLLVGANPYEKKIEKAERAEAAERARKGSSETGDKISLSEDATLRSVALRTAAVEPEARAERVAALKEQVRNGTYQPDNKKTAAGIVREDLNLII